MLFSMTGFGRAVFDAPFGRLIAEIQSVNRKYLEVFVSMPKEFGRFEHEVRKWVGEVLSRGQVSVRIFLIPTAAAIGNLLPEADFLRELKKGWERIALELRMDPKEIDLSFLMQYLPSQQKLELARDEDMPALHRCVDEALQGLLKMKKAEGKALTTDLEKRLKELERMINEIEALSPDSAKKMRQKLFEKMEEALQQMIGKGTEAEERLLREVAIFAERVDVSEEITRFRSHLTQFQDLLTPKSGAAGRKMDFLIQEMGREVNTIGSKASESKISHLVVDMKSELEKMREQIQNIE
jgi:uncharacterized protein (TIGR00255 family)